ncbi:hypothetical protein HW561_15695 [Rhodobacteraceae bacterium B1Z28]|uniref:AbiTii domain-containing protein n=1 Tax=Ruegeria haliotis TaxID=2747601 RepID=A0ABX2PSY2_9RHOB|nr:hypothetical protein [Ruegeria haliotis]NVO57236.1 hypothetical protein [Ruegeria haliotis]
MAIMPCSFSNTKTKNLDMGLARMYYGAVEVSDFENPPNLDLTWASITKIEVILDWVRKEYQQFSDFDLENLEVDSEPLDVPLENFDDLSDELTRHAVSTREILLENFVNSILSEQLDEIVDAIEKEYSEDWMPSNHRVKLNVFEEQEPFVLEEEYEQSSKELKQELIKEIPDLIDLLAAIRADLPSTFGHNQGSEFPLHPEKIQEVESKLRSVQVALKEADASSDKLIIDAGNALLNLGVALTSHIGEMTKVSTLKFAEKFGETTGTWAGRAAILAFFGEKLIQVFS